MHLDRGIIASQQAQLARVVEAWLFLPNNIRSAIVALIDE